VRIVVPKAVSMITRSPKVRNHQFAIPRWIRRLVGMALVASGAWAASASAAPLFTAPCLHVDTGRDATSVAIGDLNADGKADLALASGAGVTVVLGIGDGTFGPVSEYGTSSASSSVSIGDLNGDGRPDLVTANEVSNTVSVLLGLGDGRFGPGTDYATGIQPRGVVIGDLNGDGKPDLVVVNSHFYSLHGTISVMLGTGDGTFGEQIEYVVGDNPISLAIADLNRDGKPDLAVANKGSSTISVLAGNGDGLFGARRDYATGMGPFSIAIGDFDGDRAVDLVTANYYANTASVLLGLGDGTFGGNTDFATGSHPHSVAVGDLDENGKPDLVVVDYDEDTDQPNIYDAVAVLLGNGDGTFGSPRDHVAGSFPYSAAIGDLNGDGRPDLAVAEVHEQHSVAVLPGNGDGTFGTRDELPTGISPMSVAIGDLNGDGEPDLAVANKASNSVSVLAGEADARFSAKRDYSTGWAPVSIAVGDLNLDGNPDLAIANSGGGTVSMLLGQADGTLGLQRELGVRNPDSPYGFPQSVAIGEFDGDGKSDLAVTDMCCYFQGVGTVTVLLGNGDGTIRASSHYQVGNGPMSVAVGDFDGDGKSDLATTGYYENSVSVLMGNSAGAFGSRRDYTTGGGPFAGAVGDVNGDGIPDLVVADFYNYNGQPGNSVSVLLGKGDGTFGDQAFFAVGSDPDAVALSDLDGDGNLDVAVANSNSNSVSVLLGNGDGTFRVKSDYGTGWYPTSVAIGDLNWDGKPDLVVTNSGSNTVSVLLNTGEGVADPLAITLADAHAESGRLEFDWFGTSMAGRSATVERRSVGTAWASVARTTADRAGRLRYEDHDVRPAARYGYRLAVTRAGSKQYYGESWFTVPGAWELTLVPPAPNPVRDRLVIGFTLLSVAAARLQVLDVAGRSVADRELHSLEAGPHELTIPEAARWRPGIYLVRLTQGSHSRTARACIVH
jgi:hypothetical protein